MLYYVYCNMQYMYDISVLGYSTGRTTEAQTQFSVICSFHRYLIWHRLFYIPFKLYIHSNNSMYPSVLTILLFHRMHKKVSACHINFRILYSNQTEAKTLLEFFLFYPHYYFFLSLLKQHRVICHLHIVSIIKLDKNVPFTSHFLLKQPMISQCYKVSDMLSWIYWGYKSMIQHWKMKMSSTLEYIR